MSNLQKTLFVLVILLTFTLRFFRLSEVPPGLSGDEVAIGYNAYTILKTGKDEFGKKLPILFESYGDYKLPGYIYTTSLSILTFGKNEFAVRFPSALAGSLTVIALFFLVKDLLMMDKKSKDKAGWIGLTAALLLAVSPWHLQFSRAGFEVNLALFFYIFAVWLLIRSVKDKNHFLIWLSLSSFTLTFYTYHSFRIITPITLFGLWFIFFRKKNGYQKQLVAAFILLALVVLPLFLQTGSMARFDQTAAFDEYKTPTLVSKLYTYPVVVLRNYLSHFSTEFLVIKGDGFGRHQVDHAGLLYLWTLPFLLFGGFSLFRQKSQLKSITLLLLLTAPFAAAFTRPTPHTLRSLPLVIPLTIIISFGIVGLLTLIKSPVKKIFLVLLTVIVCYEFLFYLHHFYGHYPKVHQLDWGGAYKEMVLEAVRLKSRYDLIVVDSSQFTFAPIYFKFYGDSVAPLYVDSKWTKPDEWESKKILYVHPDYGRASERNLEKIYIPNNPYGDIFIQFWEI